MSGTDWLVVVAGLAAIAWVNWYFFVASRPTVVRRPESATTPTSASPDR
jgi:hypothetical protein